MAGVFLQGVTNENYRAFGHHITQHPWARLNVSSTTVTSGNLYTTDLNDSFYGEFAMV